MDSEGRRRYSHVPRWLREEWDGLEHMSKKSIGEFIQVWRPAMQRVPEFMGSRLEFKKYYLPQFILVGPTHSHLYLAERYKFRWTAVYLKHTNQAVEDLYQKLLSHLQELYWRHSDGDVQYPHGRFDLSEQTAWHVILDGCSVLQVLEKSDSVDPEHELEISIDKLVRVHQDLLILDNQIPFQVLRFLCNNESRLEKCLRNFLQIHGIKPAAMPSTGKPDLGRKNRSTDNGEAAEEHKVTVQDEDEPLHLLDYLRRALLMRDLGQIHREVKNNRRSRSLHSRKHRIGTVWELKAAGIRARKNPNSCFYPSFDDGKLELPELTVDGSTAYVFLNLIAYEMCPDFRQDFEVSSFLVFMSSLIDQPEDVKELRSAGILHNELANDKEVADLFNKMDIVLVPDTAWYADLRDRIQMHFESKQGKIKMLGWMGELYNTYLRSPWTIIALLAGSLGLVLTFIQTWFAVRPKGS